MRAACDEDRRGLGHSQLPKVLAHIDLAPFLQFRSVEFQAADDTHSFRTASQANQFGGVGFVLRPNAAERGKQGPEKELKELVARERAVRKASVHQEKW